MSQKIEIGVDAKLNAQQAEATAKKLGKTLGDIGRQKIELVPQDELRKLDELERRWARYQAMDRKFAAGVRNSGQAGLPFSQVDLGRAGASQAKVGRITEFVHNGVLPTPTGTGLGQAAGNAAGAAAARAAGGGLSAGVGPGLAGLLGGIAAFGVGKLVGAVTENIDKAKDNNVAYDKLKRTLGDVNVSFMALKSAVTQAGDGLSLTYGETAELASKFSRAGNLKGGDYRSLPEELGLGVGLSRAYGLDPSQGVDVLGRMRGIGVTRDVQDSRRMALLIGETIAKSDAFAKADEVMEAIASFATAQTRQSLAAANVHGYAGMFSSMVGSGIPGLDPAGAGNMLGRMNAALSAGGAKGEASQFFTSMVGNRLGLDPLQTQILREGGMFANNDNTFGKDSVYARYMGHAGPGGGQDFLSATRELIEEKYAGDSEQQKLLRANAFANHTGVNMRQAMAMLSIKPNEMGQMQKYAGDMSKLSASGINNMAMALFGTGEQRAGLAQSMLGRDDVSSADKDRLRGVMRNGSVEQQKEVLAQLSAQYEQEKTMGSDIRDSRALLDNIKTSLADKVVPALTDAKMALLYMAGVKDGKTPAEMEKAVADAAAKDRYGAKVKGINDERASLAAEKRQLGKDASAGTITPDQYATQMREINDRTRALDTESMDAKQQLDAAIKGGRGADIGDPGATSRAMRFFMNKGWSREQAAGIVANLSHESGMRPDAVGDRGAAYGVAQWHPDRQQDFERWAGKGIRGSTVEEQWGFAHYELTEGKEKPAGDRLRRTGSVKEAGEVVSRYYERPGIDDAAKAREAAARGSTADRLYRTPIPDGKSAEAPGAGAGRGSAAAYAPLRVTADPIVVRHEGSQGQQVRPDQTVNTRVSPTQPDLSLR